ncbi:hypothetical protein D5F01_LYC00190 [Larimichthys crocea]|uniref:Uncharacterized protein n=1 Tax=Larimichthys crocea TaxID=215358 RepID=A0A6G0J8I4_LARCR|nr:hypothetical protein D5F01_LYC00190 [Larimichthys crocea]
MSTHVVKISAKYRRGLSSMLLNTTLHWPFFFTKRLRRRPVPRSRPRRHEGEARQLLWTIGSFVTLKDNAPLPSSFPEQSPPPSSPRIQAPDSVCWVKGLWPLWRPRVEIFRASSSVETMLYLPQELLEINPEPAGRIDSWGAGEVVVVVVVEAEMKLPQP